MLKNFFAAFNLKLFFHDKGYDSNTSNKDIFETLQTRKSNWTPPEGQFASLDFSSKNAVMTSISLISIVTPNFPTFLRKRERRSKILVSAKTYLSKRPTKAALWLFGGPTSTKKKLCGNFLTPLLMLVTSTNQQIVKSTINDLIVIQLSATATNLIISTPRTSCIYFIPKIYKPNNPDRPIVSACS